MVVPYGFIVAKSALRDGNPKVAGLGAVLCIYPYFIANAWLRWGIGIVLSVVTFRPLRDS